MKVYLRNPKHMRPKNDVRSEKAQQKEKKGH